MKRAILAGLLLAAVPLTAVAAQNWDITAVQTSAGHRVGNPNAATKLIAFVSYTCPHCGNFELQSDAPLRAGYIQPGNVSLEVRHAIRNPLDMAAALAAECGSEDKFWGNHRAIMRAQPRWLEVAATASAAQSQRWSTGPFASRMRAMASDMDFYELMERRGFSAAELDQCLADEALARTITTNARANAARWNITGTPSFVINDELQDQVHDWASLQAILGPMQPRAAR